MKQVPLYNLVGGGADPRGKVGVMLTSTEIDYTQRAWDAVTRYNYRGVVDEWFAVCDRAMALHDQRVMSIKRRTRDDRS